MARFKAPGFTAFEVLLIALFVAVATRTVGEQYWPTLRQAPVAVEAVSLNDLAARYGPRRYSQGPEEWIVREFFDDMREGVFLDVGAFEPRKWSNTYRLEHELGWSGVAIDALEELAAGYADLRPRTRFVTAIVSASDDGYTPFHVNPRQVAVSSLDRAFTSLWGGEPQERLVRNRTLDSILEETGIDRIDFVSMDIELGEPAALAGFSIDRYQPQLVCIEAHGVTRQQILDYFADADYVLVGRYLRLDQTNLYFTPRRAGTAPPFRFMREPIQGGSAHPPLS